MSRDLRYENGEPIKIGDEVVVKRRFGRPPGVVTHVYDPAKPSPPNSDNDYGVTVALASGEYVFTSHNHDIQIILVGRATNRS